jgi:hypothetical protein
MGNELSDRQAAVRLRLAGESIENICRTLKRSKSWFHKWWKRYLALGPEGLYDLTQANQQVVNRTLPHVERAVISIRRWRRERHPGPATAGWEQPRSGPNWRFWVTRLCPVCALSSALLLALG